MASQYTNLSGDDLDAFNEFLKAEGLKPSAGLLRVFREWRRLIAGAVTVYRYATLSPDQLSLILGEAAEIKRSLKRCELVLLEPPPMTPEGLAAWCAERDAVRATLDRIHQWQDGLIRTGSIIATPPPDPELAQAIAKVSYGWGAKPTAEKGRELLFSLLRLFITIPPAPVVTAKAVATSSDSQVSSP